MDIYLLQSLCLVGLFLSMVLLTLLPSHFLRRQFAQADVLPVKYENLMSLANCVSGGVFLATFFVGLLPEVRREMVGIMTTAGIISATLPLTEVVVLLGFFLAVFVEQFALSVKRGGGGGHSHVQVTQVEPIDDSIAAPPDEQLWQNHDDSDGNDLTNFAADTAGSSCDVEDLQLTGPDGHHHHSDQHGHSHGQHGHSHGVEDLLVSTSRLRFVILLFSLGTHSLFEGMALGLQNAAPTLLNLFLGVWIHECLIAFALGFSMVKLRLSMCRLWQTAVAFSALIPCGQLVGMAIGSSQSWSGRVAGTVLQALAAGTFIQVTFLDIIPDGLGTEADGTARRMLKVSLLFAGFLVIAAVTFAVEI